VTEELIHGKPPPQIRDLAKLSVSKLADFVSIIIVIIAALAYFLTR
jgi:hypothetical protein